MVFPKGLVGYPPEFRIPSKLISAISINSGLVWSAHPHLCGTRWKIIYYYNSLGTRKMAMKIPKGAQKYYFRVLHLKCVSITWNMWYFFYLLLMIFGKIYKYSRSARITRQLVVPALPRQLCGYSFWAPQGPRNGNRSYRRDQTHERSLNALFFGGFQPRPPSSSCQRVRICRPYKLPPQSTHKRWRVSRERSQKIKRCTQDLLAANVAPTGSRH